MDNNRTLIAQCVDAFNRHDVAAAAALVSEDLVNHSAIPEAQGRVGLFNIWEKLWVSLSRPYLEVRGHGRRGRSRRMPYAHAREQFRPTTILAHAAARDGKDLRRRGHPHLSPGEGKIVETWAQRDEVGMLRQLGHLVPAGSRS